MSSESNITLYQYHIPDPARPVPEEERRYPWSPSGELIPFVPEPLKSGDVVGQRITAVSTCVGTYGMGGSGFFGLRLDDSWLVIAIWGAGGWMSAGGRAIEDACYEDYGRSKPWIPDDFDELADAIIGCTLSNVEVDKNYLRISVDGGPDLVIEESS